MNHILIRTNKLKIFKLLLFLCCSALMCVSVANAQQTKKPAKKKYTKHKKTKKKRTPPLPTFTLSGRILMIESYCGGAAPSRELLEEIKKPKPCLEKYFFIKKGEANSAKNPVIDVIKVDSTGSFSMQLKQGTYCILQDFQTKPLQLENYKTNNNFQYQGDDCMRKYWADCYQTIELKENTNDLIITVYKKCFGDNNPCMIYTGPMPP
jgi:hypothetical protein